MSIFGLTDIWVIGAYAGCILSVLFCVVYSLKKRNEPEEEDDTDE